ncbi:hypothetical protein SPI_05530 [Niveomyces insectorum RCEF 264]|uniref:Uncharacterized protein n=1 Tax=Niveomyces insectorum RCEF 264 TaxID=1081102 RepID=A0A167TB11_9HYPO|nr:hypothetical protein SPI_05530 [Niveomyces insectorum RCEF 264]
MSETTSSRNQAKLRDLGDAEILAYSSLRNLENSTKMHLQDRTQTGAAATPTSQKRNHGRSKSASLLSATLGYEDQLARLRSYTAVGGGNGNSSDTAAAIRCNSTMFPAYMPRLAPTVNNASTSITNTKNRDCDTDSIDSFELPNAGLHASSSFGSERRPQEHFHRQRKTPFREAGRQLVLQGGSYTRFLGGDNIRPIDDSSDSYGGVFGEYDDNDDDDDDVDDKKHLSDSASMSSFEVSVPTSRSRQQSVATAATSVTSGGRFSSNSRTLSALGPSSPVHAARESVSSYERRVEFKLDNDTMEDNTKKDDGGYCMDNSARDRSSDACDSIKIVLDNTQNKQNNDADDRLPVPPGDGSHVNYTVSSQKKMHAQFSQAQHPQSSWMNLDDDDEGDDSEGKSTSFGDATLHIHAPGDVPSSSSSVYSPRLATLSPGSPNKQKIRHGKMSGAMGRNDRFYNLASTPISIPRRRSSLGQLAALQQLNTEDIPPLRVYKPADQQVHRLRHFSSFSNASLSGDAPVAAPQSEKALDFAQADGDLHPTERSIRPVSSATDAATTADKEHSMLLPPVVYRQPSAVVSPLVPSRECGTTAGRKSPDRMPTNKKTQPDDAALVDRDSSERTLCIEPVSQSHFDETDDTVVHKNQVDSVVTDDDDANFDDFEGAYDDDDEKDEIMMATMMPFSKQLPRSLHTPRSMASLSEAVPIQSTVSSFPVSAAVQHPRSEFGSHASDRAVLDDAEEAPVHLQSWIHYAFRRQRELPQPPEEEEEDEEDGTHANDQPSHVESNDDYVACEDDKDAALQRLQDMGAGHDTTTHGRHQHRQEDLSSKDQPLLSHNFQTPGVVGIPLPREVIDTLRVSVSCFPETMLSLSSFSIQTIRSYSHKVRRGGQSDTDSAHRFLLSPSSSMGGWPPSPTAARHITPPALSSSPTTTSFCDSSSDSRTNLFGPMRAPMPTSQAPSRFWKLSKRLIPSRTSPNLGALTGRGPSSDHGSFSGRNNRLDDVSDEDHDKASGACLKRIFPTGSDYLCDALYAHILAFNYIGLLCPAPSPAPVPAPVLHPASLSSSPSRTDLGDPSLTAKASTIATATSTATLYETAEHQKRQTIRVYVGSDVALSSASPTPPAPSPTPPPSRGRMADYHDDYSYNYSDNDKDNNDSNRMVSRKAARLLGMSETLEPDSRQSVGGGSFAHSVVPGLGSLGQRYNVLRRRRRPLTIKTATPPAPPAKTETPKRARPYYAQSAANTGAASASSDSLLIHMPPSTTTSADTSSLRDLHAGLQACISQLVGTLKLTAGQLGAGRPPTTDGARTMDPLFLRTLCELVRSQEEQF